MIRRSVLALVFGLFLLANAPVAAFDIDVDGNGERDALTDGLLALRYLFGFTDTTLIEGAVGNNATRATAAQIEAYLQTNLAQLDIDNDDNTDALTDGLLVLRYLFGFEGNALLQGAISSGATRTGATEIEAYIESLRTRTYTVTPISGFTIEGAIPNITLVKDGNDNDVVLLVYSSPVGLCEATSTDGLTFSGTGIKSSDLIRVLDPVPQTLYVTDVLVRPLPSGTRRYFIKALTPPGNTERHIYLADRTVDGVITLGNDHAPVYTGGPNDDNRVEVFDIIEALDGKWVMYYVSPTGTPMNSGRSAISSDRGLSWTFHNDDPFSDKGMARAQDRNVDPAVLRLQDDTFIAVTMRAAKLYFWNSADGYVWEEIGGSEINISQWDAAEVDDAIGLFDPTLLQLPDGTIYMYVTAGQGTTDRLVAAKITY